MPQNTMPWKGKDAVDDLPIATTTQQGVVHAAAHQAHSTAADLPALVADYNTLVDKLTAAGLIAGA